MNATRLTAPASKIFTVLHVVDQSAPWVEDLRGDKSTCGRTMCGLDMYTAESWQLLEQLPGESLCPRCTGEGADYEQEALL